MLSSELVPSAGPGEVRNASSNDIRDTTAGTDANADKDSDGIAVKLVRGKNGRLDYVPRTRLLNDLSWAVGLMELANAGDFAANVWNEVPVPVYAVVFMAIGGTVAAAMCVVAFHDARLACRNVRFLRRQRRDQKAERAARQERGQSTLDLDVYLSVTFRELGSEIVTRWLTNLLMGCGALIISIGTFMAIGGANPTVWFASNVLSGYLGNAPIALYGVVTLLWASYVFCKAQGHIWATRRSLRGTKAAALVRRRARTVQAFCVVNGTAAVLGGVASLLTATQWWAYVMLIPVIAASVFCNVWWRRRVGYSRAKSPAGANEFPALSLANLVVEVESAARAGAAIRGRKASPIDEFVADPTSLAQVLRFLQRNMLLEVFCLKACSVPHLCRALGADQDTEVTIGVDQLLAVSKECQATLLEMARECAEELGSENLEYRQRYTAELLGTYCRLVGGVGGGSGIDVDEK
ncbi:hypothetical protein CDD83_3729 [Cordyceps sp. RAO-2017]|nr:hypothetical protein CDD83_3729 [Cordyceps sp. RAO-2017]